MAMFDDPMESFLNYLARFGLEFFKRYYGPYKARVVNNKDPQGLGRIIVEVKRAVLAKENSQWVFPMMTGAGKKRGVFWPPEINDYVFVFFDNGDPMKPLCYMGGWYVPQEIDEDLSPESDGTPKKRGIMTPAGHKVVISDKEGQEQITIRHKDGTIVQWTSDKKVKIGNEDGNFEPMLKGSTVKQWLETHTHPHSWGPTGVPIQPLPANALSDDTETS